MADYELGEKGGDAHGLKLLKFLKRHEDYRDIVGYNPFQIAARNNFSKTITLLYENKNFKLIPGNGNQWQPMQHPMQIAAAAREISALKALLLIDPMHGLLRSKSHASLKKSLDPDPLADFTPEKVVVANPLELGSPKVFSR